MNSVTLRKEIETDWAGGSNVATVSNLVNGQRAKALYKTPNEVVVVALLGTVQKTLVGKSLQNEVEAEDNAGDLNRFKGEYEVDLDSAVNALADFLSDLDFNEQFSWEDFDEIDEP